MKQIAVVVSIGKSDVNQELTVPNAAAAKADGIEIFVVGLYSLFTYIPPSTCWSMIY